MFVHLFPKCVAETHRLQNRKGDLGCGSSYICSADFVLNRRPTHARAAMRVQTVLTANNRQNV